MIFPFVLTSVAAGGLFAVLGARVVAWARLGWLAALAGVTGLVGGGVVTAAGVLPDNHYWAVAGVLGLTVFAIAAPTAGLGLRLGHAGYTLAGLVYVLGGLLGAGAAVPQQFQLGLWRILGPYLPPGAAVDAVRNVTYFDAADIWLPLFVLGAYAAAGGALMAYSRSAVTRRAEDEAAVASSHAETPPAASAVEASVR